LSSAQEKRVEVTLLIITSLRLLETVLATATWKTWATRVRTSLGTIDNRIISISKLDWTDFVLPKSGPKLFPIPKTFTFSDTDQTTAPSS
jgi:hypothetical protein